MKGLVISGRPEEKTKAATSLAGGKKKESIRPKICVGTHVPNRGGGPEKLLGYWYPPARERKKAVP